MVQKIKKTHNILNKFHGLHNCEAFDFEHRYVFAYVLYAVRNYLALKLPKLVECAMLQVPNQSKAKLC